MDTEKMVREYIEKHGKELTERQVEDAAWLVKESQCDTAENQEAELKRVVRAVFYMGCNDGVKEGQDE